MKYNADSSPFTVMYTYFSRAFEQARLSDHQKNGVV